MTRMITGILTARMINHQDLNLLKSSKVILNTIPIMMSIIKIKINNHHNGILTMRRRNHQELHKLSKLHHNGIQMMSILMMDILMIIIQTMNIIGINNHNMSSKISPTDNPLNPNPLNHRVSSKVHHNGIQMMNIIQMMTITGINPHNMSSKVRINNQQDQKDQLDLKDQLDPKDQLDQKDHKDLNPRILMTNTHGIQLRTLMIRNNLISHQRRLSKIKNPNLNHLSQKINNLNLMTSMMNPDTPTTRMNNHQDLNLNKLRKVFQNTMTRKSMNNNRINNNHQDLNPNKSSNKVLMNNLKRMILNHNPNHQRRMLNPNPNHQNKILNPNHQRKIPNPNHQRRMPNPNLNHQSKILNPNHQRMMILNTITLMIQTMSKLGSQLLMMKGNGDLSS